MSAIHITNRVAGRRSQYGRNRLIFFVFSLFFVVEMRYSELTFYIDLIALE
jgi:hypothetical protein